MTNFKKNFTTYPFQYFPQYYSRDNLLHSIKENITFKQDNIIIGRGEDKVERKEKRKTRWLSNDENLIFEYSGKIMKPDKIPNIIQEIMDMIYKDFGIKFDGVLVNYYENGQVGMGYHSDPIDNKWDNNFIVYSIGDERKIIFREKGNIDNKIEYLFANGDLIYMYDDCQDKYEHSIRKNKGDGERISLVFKKSN
jgi:alkylated DNA repair dioxygenase AlkB